MNTEQSSGDRWAEWKKLFFYDTPAGIRASGALVRPLIAIGAAILFVRLTLWAVIQYMISSAEALRPIGWPQVAVLVSLVVGLVVVFVGICVCVYRYLDSK